MYSYLINIGKIISENLPASLRKPRRILFLKAMLSPLRALHTIFKAFIDNLFYFASYNGGMQSLTTALNDKFDPSLRRITVVDAFFDPTFIFYTTESQPAPYAYYVWEAGLPFASGHFCIHNGLLYKANATPTGSDVPGVSSKWDLQPDDIPYIHYTQEYTSEITFIVQVPSAITFSEDEMKALINSLVFAGPGYAIKIV